MVGIKLIILGVFIFIFMKEDEVCWGLIDNGEFIIKTIIWVVYDIKKENIEV